MSKKQYVGKGKVVGNYGNIKIGIKAATLPINEKGYVNLIISRLKQKDQWGNEFTVYVDDSVPNKPKTEDVPF